MSVEKNDDIEFDITGLEKLIKATKRLPYARVGILGDRSVRAIQNGEVPTLDNAEIGAVHEFGTSKLPQRSFLRVPISENLENYLEKAGAFDADALAEIVKNASFTPFMQKVGIVGVGVVLDAFDTGGFGKWPPSDMRYKKNHQTLVETKQLRDSIVSDVKT